MEGAENTDTAICMRDVHVRYPNAHLRFDCAIRRGEIVAVVGASGSGKSTLFNVVAGFETPDAGQVDIFGRIIDGVEPSDRPVSIIFQDHNLFSHLDVFTNIGLGISAAMRLGVKERGRIAGSMMRVGLEGFGKRLPPTLSGGERQRVALARALVRRKPILLLDEPFAALDPGLRAGMSQLLLDLHAEEENTILIITHHPDDLRRLADSVVFLDGGRIVAHQPTAEFLARRDNAAINAFLGN